MRQSATVTGVVVRLGRKQTPQRYLELSTIDRDIAAAEIRTRQLERDWQRSAEDLGKLAEARTILASKVAAMDEVSRANRKARRAGTTPQTDENGG